ncbi:hypothetical protein EU527_08150 [Candidatus Thorarchaeota archaeon]|nr:MAG: hypothetical protein EU527_08150 [Candidatus Thorarchaeota archaeon]
MSGIANIIDIINAKTTERTQEIIKEAERHKRLKLDEAERRANEVADAIAKKAAQQAKSELSKYESGAKLKSKYQMLEAKESLINEVLLKVNERMESIITKTEYKRILSNLIIDGCIALKKEKLELIFPKNHSSKIEIAEIEKTVSKEVGKKVSLIVSKDTIRSKGGVIIRTIDGTKWVDNTFEARMERLEKKVRDTISSILFTSEK